MPPLVIAAPVELSSALPTEIFRYCAPSSDAAAARWIVEPGGRLRWARCGPTGRSYEVGVDVAGATSGDAVAATAHRDHRTQRRWTLPDTGLPSATTSCRMGCRITDVSLAADCLHSLPLLPGGEQIAAALSGSVITQLSQGCAQLFVARFA